MSGMVDVVIVGAGPAGIAAALEASAQGLSVTLIDEQPAPGGQIWRGVEQAQGAGTLGQDYVAGADRARALRASGIDYRPATTLWHLDEAGVASVLSSGHSDQIEARRVILATGAMERPVPIPGWTLPGVMTAGAAQILLKTAAAVPQGPVVLAGQGPLLWLIAQQLVAAGAPPTLILETRRASPVATALGHLSGLWRGREWVAKGLTMMRAVQSAGVRVVTGASGLRAEGKDRLERVTWSGGAQHAATLLLHEGVIPNVQVSLALGLAHEWDTAQLCWRPRLDAFGATSETRIAIAGDGAGIGGWQAAEARGRLAALDAAHRLGRLDAAQCDALAAPWQAELGRALAIRPFLDALYRPAKEVLLPPDAETIVCRCEEVSARRVREAARLGATGPNQAKAYLRCGMGPCQGRLCGPTVAALIADERGVPVQTVGTYRPRAPYKPITVAELADG
ncbi:FAD/NAD(P)-dependent oxidoreductase [Elioraea rosea]|uniref:FAD/NAD(P)-dependent oxidoreductase n=1 Tax=Elioraea rosea TaxID=2492390 RepID=UPI0011825C88|nr:NAD(P)/FAD-dependent oxidoreductase [Elioraea rosea]